MTKEVFELGEKLSVGGIAMSDCKEKIYHLYLKMLLSLSIRVIANLYSWVAMGTLAHRAVSNIVLSWQTTWEKCPRRGMRSRLKLY